MTAIILSFAAPTYAGRQVVVKVDRSTPIGISHFRIGVTFTGQRWRDGNPEAVQRAKDLLANGLKLMNQHITIFDAGDPEPRPGVYDWSTLDKQMALIRSMHGTPVITLCCAPGWMNTIGQTQPRRTGPYSWDVGRVTDSHVKDYAELCKKVALRYPDVKYFQVWNEFKGYYDKAMRNYDYVRYTKFYNAVYDAIKSVRPDANLGGPYFPFDKRIRKKNWEAIDYWLKHKRGAQFVCFDGWIDGYPPTSSRKLEAYKMTLTDYFGKIADQFRAKTNLPIWISEFYGGWSSNPQFTAANNASCYLHSLLSGVSVALLWGPANQRWNYLFTRTATGAGGRPSPHYRVVKIFNTYFGPGTRLYKATSSSRDIEVLASATKTLLINKLDSTVPVQLDGRRLSLTPYEVRLLNALKKS